MADIELIRIRWKNFSTAADADERSWCFYSNPVVAVADIGTLLAALDVANAENVRMRTAMRQARDEWDYQADADHIVDAGNQAADILRTALGDSEGETK